MEWCRAIERGEEGALESMARGVVGCQAEGFAVPVWRAFNDCPLTAADEQAIAGLPDLRGCRHASDEGKDAAFVPRDRECAAQRAGK